MAEDFGLRIGLEGEKEFKQALSDINSRFKVLGSEMKLVQSQFAKNDTSMEALTGRNQVLSREISAQKEKIATLRAALDNAAASFGETDRRTQRWQIQLNNAEAALNNMERELKTNNTALQNADGSMDDAAGSADDLSAGVEDAGKAAEQSEGRFNALGSSLKAVGVAMGAAVLAAGKMAYDLGKSVVAAYADYEQLVGGVETLFGAGGQSLEEYATAAGKSVSEVEAEYNRLLSAQGTVLKNAANAYKTAGLSQNAYMDTVAGFSASLIASLGGDTEKAARYAHMAITDMADNANKMGTDMASIQNAYQGFAKQNYGMLDNLKLGFGGTKAEMERLLSEAEKISGVHYNLGSYADVVSAIHVIQENMGIAGTTAKEAEKTIAGSMSAMKSAFQNMLVGFGSAQSDMKLLCDNLVDAFRNALRNITPVIANIVSALPSAFGAMVQALFELLPTVLSSATDIVSQVLGVLLSLPPMLIPVATQAVLTLVQTLVENLPLMMDAAVQLMASLVSGLGAALPTLIPAAVNAVATIVQGLADSLPLMLDAALQLITGLAQGILETLPVLIEALPAVIQGIVDFVIGAIPQIVETGVQLLTALVAALPDIISAIVAVLPQLISGVVTALLEALPTLAQAGVELLTALIQDMPTILATVISALPQLISGIVTTLAENIPQIVQAGVELLTALTANLPQIIATIVASIPQIITGIVTALGAGVSQIADVGANLVRGLWDGIVSLKDWLWNSVSGWISGIWNGIKDFFGIHSPSKQMAWVGEMLVKGLSGSIRQNGDEAVSAANRMARDINGVMAGLAKDMSTALPTSFSFRTPDMRPLSSPEKEDAYGTVSLTGNNFYMRDERDIQSLALEIAALTRRRQVGMGLRMA